MRGLLVIFFFGICSSFFAQQVPQFTLSKYDKFRMNPAFAGLDRSLSITGTYRNQWQGIQGNPNDQYLTLHMPLYIWGGGVGLEFGNDNIGELQNSLFKVAYSRVVGTSFGFLGLGAKVGIQRISINSDDIRTSTGIYSGNTIDHNDLLLANGNINASTPSIEIGAFFTNKKMNAGLSIENLALNSESTPLGKKLSVDFYLDYQIDISEVISVTPSVFVKTDLVSMQSEIVGEVNYRRNSFALIGMRGYSANTLDALILGAGTNISKKVKIVYSYGLGLSELRNFHDGTHEIIINYNLSKPIGIGQAQKIIYNPRYL